ncbi:MAG: hypothetical protein KDD35_03275 [Bdellovibrionales bacterium]|nr:hypothetical protein [Bdellovibrionales bacterium]
MEKSVMSESTTSNTEAIFNGVLSEKQAEPLLRLFRRSSDGKLRNPLVPLAKEDSAHTFHPTEMEKGVLQSSLHA